MEVCREVLVPREAVITATVLVWVGWGRETGGGRTFELANVVADCKFHGCTKRVTGSTKTSLIYAGCEID